MPFHALEDRAGDEIHAELASNRSSPVERVTVERLGRCAQLLLGADRGPLLGEYDQRRAIRGGGAREAVGDGEIRCPIGG